MQKKYLGLVLWRISSGLFLVSAAKTTVISLPAKICLFIWYCASEASYESTNCTNAKPRGSLYGKKWSFILKLLEKYWQRQMVEYADQADFAYPSNHLKSHYLVQLSLNNLLMALFDTYTAVDAEFTKAAKNPKLSCDQVFSLHSSRKWTSKNLQQSCIYKKHLNRKLLTITN